MPRGITQDQVNGAADALLAAGERPTIERIRQRLGTGSPNTLARLIDNWWGTLAGRLAAAQSVTMAPDPVHALTRDLWGAALAHAQRSANEALEAERAALAADRDTLTALAEGAQAGAQTLIEQRELAVQRYAAVSVELTHSKSLNQSLTGLLEQVRSQLTTSEARTEALASDVAKLSRAIEAERTTARERERAQETHWVAEVDRARIEAKTAREELASVRAQERTLANKRAQELALVRTDARKVRESLDAELQSARMRIAHVEREHQAQHRQLVKVLAERAALAAKCVTLERHVKDLVRRPTLAKPIRGSKPRRPRKPLAQPA